MVAMNNRGSIFPIIPIIVSIIVISAVAVYPQLEKIWSSPLAPSMEFPTSSSPTLSPPQVIELSQQNDDLQTFDSSTLENQPTPNPNNLTQLNQSKPFCGGPEVLYILGVGADSGIDYYYGLADIIRLVRVDFVTPKVTVLTIPRDFWVEIPDLETKYEITHGKINQAYLYGGSGMGYYSGPGGGPGLLARTLEHNFTIHVDHYTAINMETFAKIIDAVGGVDVSLPYAVDGKTAGRGYYPAGRNHLTGEQALDLARIRLPYNDFIRQDNQSIVIDAMIEKFKDPLVFIKIPNLINTFQDSILTDLSLKQISQFICLYPKLRRENIRFTGLPSEIMSNGRIYSPQQKDYTYIIEADFEIVKDYITHFKDGTWPE